jgi:hypothetical protein
MFFETIGHRMPEKIMGHPDLPGKFTIDWNAAERRFISGDVIHKRALQEQSVQKSDDHHALELPAFDQFVGFGGDLPGVIITGVRDDQGPDIRGGNTLGRGQEVPDLFSEKFRFSGIELPAHRRPADYVLSLHGLPLGSKSEFILHPKKAGET